MRASSTVVAVSFSLLASSLLAASAVAAPTPSAKPAGSASKSATGSTPTSTGAASGTPAASSGPSTGATGGPSNNASPPASEPPPDLAAVKPEDMPTAVRMRRLEQKTQALKERAWQLKARVQMLKEQMIGGGVGAQAVVAHNNEMGASFRLTKLIYALDGTQVFARTDDSAENLYKTKEFDVFAGPIAPGNHSLSASATYRGHGYGVFEYLSKYTFTATGNQAFMAGEGMISKVDCRGFEKGGPTTPLEKRAAIECRVAQVQPERPADKPDAAKPAGGPAPGTPPNPTSMAPISPPAPTPVPDTSATKRAH